MSERQEVDLTPAYLLHRRPWRETSALLEVFAREHGRIGLVARGARRPRSALRLALRPFTPLLLGWAGRGELGTLRRAEVAGSIPELGRGALAAALYLNELLLKLTHRHDPHPELFDAYARASTALAAGAQVENVLRVFEARLLEAIGYGPVLDCEPATGEPIDPGRCYAYHRERGPMSAAGELAGCVAVHGATLLALDAGEPLDPGARREAKRLMRHLLEPHLGDRPLATRALFREAD